MQVWVVGLSHETADVSLREAVALDAGLIPEALSALAAQGARESAILSTCNRTEVYVVSGEGGEAPAIAREFLAARVGAEQRPHLEAALYALEGEMAARHLFAVAGGLKSLVLGEAQILGQVKEAYRLSAERGAAGPVISHLFQQALHAGKRVRSETGIGQGAVSVSYAAVELARKIFEDLADKVVLLVGAGKMAELAVKNLADQGSPKILVANRTREHAAALARAHGGEAVPFAELEEALAASDIVITSTGARKPVLTREAVRRAAKRRRGKPLLIIDIAVPRDVDPAVHELDGVFLYNIDDLRAVAEANAAERRLHLPRAEAIVAEEAAKFARWLRRRAADPVIRALREKFKATADREVERLLRRLPDLAESQREQVRAFSASIVGKLLHDATMALKQFAEEGRHEEAFRLIAEMFALELGGAGEKAGGPDREQERKEPPRSLPLLRPEEGTAS